MIVEKRIALPDDDTPTDAPPAYSDALGAPPATLIPPSEKSEGGLTLPLSLDTFVPFQSHKERPQSWRWFSFGLRSRVAKQVRVTVLGILRDLVKQPDISSSASAILESCADACRMNNLSISTLLQEPSVEGHTPLYWAIIKRAPGSPVEPEDPSSPDLLESFLSIATPFTETTISDIRLACLNNADHALYQRLRRSPAFSPLSGAEEVLLGGLRPVDEINVLNVEEDDCAFVVDFRIPLFQKRLRVSKQLNLEFIAKDRLWSLKFLIAAAENSNIRPIAETGTWLVTLALLEHSAPTAVDSNLIIKDATIPASPSPSSPSVLSRQTKGKPTITLRMKTGTTHLAPDHRDNVISTSFKDSLMAESLQYNASPYVAADGSLTARLEARLGRPDGECIIC